MATILDTIGQDLRHAARTLGRSPGFSLTAILTLALGIGATTAMYSIVDAVLLRPLPYEDSERIVAVFERDEGTESPTSPAIFTALDEMDRFVDLTAATVWSPVIRSTGDASDVAGPPQEVNALKATPSLFRLLGTEPLLGRTFPDDAELAANAAVVVVSHALWQTQFGSDPDIVGRRVSLDGETHDVIGVMAEGFAFPPFWAQDAKLWVPLMYGAEERQGNARYLRVFGRLGAKDSAGDLSRVQAEVEALAARLREERPEDNRGLSLRVTTLMEPTVGGVRQSLLVFFAGIGLVLLIACANVGHLQLVRATARDGEFSIRAALGAGRTALVRQLLTESTLLALAAGGLGGLFGMWALELLVALGPDDVMPRLAEVAFDWRILSFGVGVSLVSGLVAGLPPVVRLLRGGTASSLRSGRRTVQAGGEGLRGLLVVAEVALALVLLVGAGLLLRTFFNVSTLDPGFATGDVSTLQVNLVGTGYAAAERQFAFFDRLVDEVDSLPGVDAALVNHLPIGGDIWGLRFLIEGQDVAPAEELSRATYRVVSDGLFATLDVPVLRGRVFDRRDVGGPPVVVVNHAFAHRFFGGDDPVGRRLRMGGPSSSEPWMTIVGQVGDVRQWELTDDPSAEIYFPYAQNPVSFWAKTTLVLRTTGDAEHSALVAAATARVETLAPDVALGPATPMASLLDEAMQRRRWNASVLSAFAATALLLAALGIYSVIAYGVRQRRREIGLRLALGAGNQQILRLVVGRCLRLTGLGLALGALGALVVSRSLGSLLFGISAQDPATFVGVALLLGLVAVLASSLPARRAMAVDPALTLRSE